MTATTSSLGLSLDPPTDAFCPCRRPFRLMQEATDDEGNEEEEGAKLWEVIYTSAVLIGMFAALLSDRIGADSIMLVALTFFMAGQIITIEEGLAGFSNEGLITVLSLFVVADGIAKTGALDWYMGKLLGRPRTIASAQARLMVPVAIVSAFLNNTPVVVVMIPIVQKWAKNCNMSVQQLLIPLSFATILGGTCTLIGTSTNLVVVGLLDERYPNDPSMEIGLFDLSIYGVPIAFAGICYLLLASPCLLPGGARKSESGSVPTDNQEDILMGARLTAWSPAAGRSVKRSGLRDTGGIYLVSVHRAATGNVHRAVGQEFVLNAGDILFFTGLVEEFGEFCEEHGMEVVTNEHEQDEGVSPLLLSATELSKSPSSDGFTEHQEISSALRNSKQLGVVAESREEYDDSLPSEVGVTKESLLQADEAERSRAITRMTDMIRGLSRDEPKKDEMDALSGGRKKQSETTGAPKVVVTSDNEFVIIGVDAHDRPGLLLDISKGLARANLNLHHTEARVVEQRSISIWRCEMLDLGIADLEEIWSILNALLENDHDAQASKRKGSRVIRAVVTKTSSLNGKNVAETNFRNVYKAAIVAVQKGGKNVPLSGLVFGPGDVLILQANPDSPLLQTPPDDFYKMVGTGIRSNSVTSFVHSITKRVSGGNVNKRSEKEGEEDRDLEASTSNNDLLQAGPGESTDIDADDEAMIVNMTNDSPTANEIVWRDLMTIFRDDKNAGNGAASREFLTAMEVAKKSKLPNRTVFEIGLDKLPGVVLVSIDRPTTEADSQGNQRPKVTIITPTSPRPNSVSHNEDCSAVASIRTLEPQFEAITPDAPLKAGDVLWFAGSAASLGDLRKVPGLKSHESEEVKKMKEHLHDRRLVEAVVARRGPLVGKTVKEVQFRTRFGAAVISVHREGKRIHDHPGRIKLQAGDVLLLEAGPTFIQRGADNEKSFALLAEVKDSAPPRLRLLIPALVITVAMLAVYTAGVTSLLICAMVASILMVLLGILSEQEVRNAINWDIFCTIGAAFGIGTALVNGGVAGGIANFLVDIGEAFGIGDAGLLGAVYLATFLISNVVTNNAAAALLFPVAMDAADQTGTDRILMAYCLMLGASASFMSPFGYTTNLLIYGPGGYKTKDFIYIGTPMQVVLWILSILLLVTTTNKNWWISWLLSAMAVVLVLSTRMLTDLVSAFKNKRTSSPKEEEGAVRTSAN